MRIKFSTNDWSTLLCRGIGIAKIIYIIYIYILNIYIYILNIYIYLVFFFRLPIIYIYIYLSFLIFVEAPFLQAHKMSGHQFLHQRWRNAGGERLCLWRRILAATSTCNFRMPILIHQKHVWVLFYLNGNSPWKLFLRWLESYFWDVVTFLGC